MPEELLVLLVIPSALFIFCLCFPYFIALFRRQPVRCGVVGGPEDIHCHWQSDVSEQRTELVALGFRPAGIYWDRIAWFGGLESAYVTHAQDCCARAYRMTRRSLDSVVFLTTFTSGAVVTTQNIDYGEVVRLQDYWSGPPPMPSMEPESIESPETASKTVWPGFLLHAGIHLALIAVGIVSMTYDHLFLSLAMFAVAVITYPVSKRLAKKAEKEKRLASRAPLAVTLALHRRRVCQFLEEGQVLQPVAGLVDVGLAHQTQMDHWHMRWTTRVMCLVIVILVPLLFLALPAIFMAVDFILAAGILFAECLAAAVLVGRHWFSARAVVAELRKPDQ